MPLRFVTEEFSQRLIKNLIRESKKLQKRQKGLIGFQGERGAYSEEAALSFNKLLLTIPCGDFKTVFRGVSEGWLDYGVVPIENSTEGQINSVSDLFIEYDLKIIGEIILPVHHCLLTLPGLKLRQIRTVISHPQALAQCQQFIRKNKFEAHPFYDTAGAARMLAEERLSGVAAIASKKCAELYGLSVLKENIEDYPANQTRFLILARKGLDQGYKCSIVFSLKHEPGSLARVLSLFAEKGINLTRIESRPNKRRPGEYFFLVDFEGSLQENEVKKALSQVKNQATFYRFLGCYDKL
ncbi:MAG: prephenate dehydratase [Candidatus Aminicenantes bacterium]|nr:prephenate dehydratase [Candidatus Aminicenantes bacterium]